MRCQVYELGFLEEYKYVVVLSEYNGKIVLSRHKERATWETQGGHIEQGETPLDAAKRELYEESGAVDFEIKPLCDYRAWNEESVMANGDITACLDIERRPQFIQGNILKDRFKEIWDSKFQVFRRDLSDMCESCSLCSHVKYCHGDSFHSWDFDNNQPLLCFKDVLF